MEVENEELTQEDINRFWSRINIRGPDECWEWTAGLSNGYGEITYHKKKFRCHRLSYAINIGPIPKGKLVLHKCDNKPCCNPNHLYVGSYGDNILDVIKRQSPKLGKPSMFNLTEVLTMKKLHTNGMSPKVIAENYGVSRSYIYQIIRGERGINV